jgi:hypothetical protein
LNTNDVRRGSIDDITPEEWNSLNDVAVGVRHDPVNQPSHYRVGEVEAIRYIEQQLGSGVRDYLLGNLHKYLHRHRFKGNALEDLKKAQWYLTKLIMEEEQGG